VLFDVLINQFIKDRSIHADDFYRLEDGRLLLRREMAGVLCGAVRLFDSEQRNGLVKASGVFDGSVTQSVIGGLHTDEAWSAGMLEHIAAEAALTLLIAAKLGVVAGSR